MKLAPITVWVVDQQTVENRSRINALLQALKTTDTEIRIGVGLGGDSANAGTDVRNS
jgi:hypothetical protein